VNRDLLDTAAHAIAEKLGIDIVALDMTNQLLLSECFLIATSPNEKALGAIADEVIEKVSKLNEKPVRIEKSSGWILLDYVDLVIHLQTQEVRHFYALERLWNDSPRIELAVSELR
jgi:ribosome-associated protein